MQNKNDLVIALLYAPGPSGERAESIKGITRLMKLLFLVNKSIEEGVRLDFEAFKMGPYSPDVYSSLEFFQNYPSPENPIIEVLKKENDKHLPNLETSKYFDDADNQDSQSYFASNSIFRLTDLGKLVAKEVWENDLDELVKNNIEVIKVKYGGLPLRSLLRHVYDTYPEMTVNSEIKDIVYGQ